MTSNVIHHEDHLRFLLDQRAARADLHGRFPSQSDFSDSPSLYSHAHFSPQPSDTDAHSIAFHYTISSHNHRAPSPDFRSPVSDRERLNFPEASSLDLDDDSQSSLFYSVEGGDDDDNSSQASQDDAEGEEDTRVSTYGPKMRFHSRAPWETGEEDDLPDDSSARRKKHPGKKSDAPKKSWGLPSRTSHDTRPSVESTRSQGKMKQSLDAQSTSSNGSALLALAQASMSSTSLALSSSPSPQSTLRDKLNFPRLRTRTSSSAKGLSKPDTVDTRSIASAAPSYSVHASPVSHYRTMSPTESLFSSRDIGPPSPGAPMHPYANPDLVRLTVHDNASQQHLNELHALASTSSVFPPAPNRSESGATLTDSTSSSTMAHSGSESTVTLTPVTSMSSMQSKFDISPVPRSGGAQRGISAPVSVNKSMMRNIPPQSPPGAASGNFRDTTFSASATPNNWVETSGASTIKLISLAEAQAQARERSRSATATVASVAASNSAASRNFDFDPPPSPAVSSQSGWSRMRSVSAGSSKSKTGVSASGDPVPPMPTDYPSSTQSQQGGNQNPHRAVTRKKSGFMRLFNGKERPHTVYTPPATPSTQTAPPSPGPPVPRKVTSHRVPVPSIAPLEAQNTGSNSSSGSDRLIAGSIQQQLSARRNVPGLSIVTHPPSSTRSTHRSASPGLSESAHHGQLLTPTTAASSFAYSSAMTDSSIPNSAPPASADFLGVNIRPVSTMFTKNFSEHLVTDRFSSDQPRPSLETDTGTPTTASAISPRSPAFLARSSDEKHLPIGIASQQDDQSSVIQALQEQIMTARRAWQRQIWELEGQVRDLKAEVDGLRMSDSSQEYCATCGRGSVGRPTVDGEGKTDDHRKAGGKSGGVVNRPRARTGVGSRFASAT
ncbi:unnamed protein product [Somion occarium]|uniref:Uncharacterized protein n=1 Tax=Somion occarium TaxID=3059160 RepID=A0ABP1CL16_9APHY